MKKVFAVLCGCMMILLAACGGKNIKTDDTANATPTAAVTEEPTVTSPVEPQATVTAEPTAVVTTKPDAEPTATPTVKPEETTIVLPTPTTAVEITPVPDPVRDEESTSAKDFVSRFEAIGKERAEQRRKELNDRFDGRAILEDNTLYIAYLDLTTLPKEGFKRCEEWDGWYRWTGEAGKHEFFDGITFTEEEYREGVLEIEVREAVACGANDGGNGRIYNAYWLYFRNCGAEDIYDYTIYELGCGDHVDPTGEMTRVSLYYRSGTDRDFDLTFELEHRAPASEDGKTYRIGKHISVLGVMSGLHEVEYYVDTVVKECDNADGSTTTETVGFDILDMELSDGEEETVKLASGSLCVGAKKAVEDDSESGIEKASMELVKENVALSGYLFCYSKGDDVCEIRFGDGVDLVEVVVTIGIEEENGVRFAVIEKLALNYSGFFFDRRAFLG